LVALIVAVVGGGAPGGGSLSTCVVGLDSATLRVLVMAVTCRRLCMLVLTPD
jgi:hypothetical protein